MATLDPNFTLELTHITLGNRVFSYASMPLNPALPDASQIQVRWNVTTVYQGNPQTSGGTPVTVSDLSQTLQDEIQTLLGTMYVVDAVAKTVTINADSTIVDQITFGNYYFPGTFLVSQVTPLVLRRDTNVTNPTVVFSPGSRLTSELLNTSDSQMLNAIQEIVAFGDGNSSGGGSGGTVDLGTYSIFDLGDVSAASGSGLLSYDTGTGLVTTGASGSLLPAGGGTAEYLRKSSNVDGAVEWYDLNTELNTITGSIASNGSAITTLQDKTQNITASPDDTVIAGNISATGVGGTVKAELFEFKGNNLNGFLFLGSTSTTPNSSANNYKIQAFPSSTATADQRNIWRLNSSGWVYMFNRWQANGEDLYNHPRLFQNPNQYSQNVQGTHNSVGDASYILNRGGGGFYQAMLSSHNRIYSNNPGTTAYTNSKLNYVHLRDDLNGQYNYTMMTSPGDHHSNAFSVIKNSSTIFSVNKTAGSVYSGGSMTATDFLESSDGTLKTYVPSQNPVETTTTVIDKIQAIVNTGEAASPPIFGAFEYNSNPGTYYYGPTTQALAAHGLELIKGPDVNVPGEEAQAADTRTDGAADVPATPAVPAVPATQTLSVVSLSGLAIKCSAQLKDITDGQNTRITALESAPSSGIQSNIGTGGSGSGAIANMVTISTGDYGTLGTPDPTTVYFLTP
tara:strand:- start:813 stop:2852 length:2040 start_codon:yes stop_codon:yes gene_type:complete